MPQYDWPELNLEPEELASSIDAEDHYSTAEVGDDEHDIEGELDDLEDHPEVRYAAWKNISSQINRPAALKLQEHYLLKSRIRSTAWETCSRCALKHTK